MIYNDVLANYNINIIYYKQNVVQADYVNRYNFINKPFQYYSYPNYYYIYMFKTILLFTKDFSFEWILT